MYNVYVKSRSHISYKIFPFITISIRQTTENIFRSSFFILYSVLILIKIILKMAVKKFSQEYRNGYWVNNVASENEVQKKLFSI